MPMINKLLEQLKEAMKEQYPKGTTEVLLRLDHKGWQVSYKQGEGKPIKS